MILRPLLLRAQRSLESVLAYSVLAASSANFGAPRAKQTSYLGFFK
jgi:hypothetical protein